MRVLSAISIVLSVALLAAGCDSTEPSPRGAVQGLVLAEGNPLPGVTVEVSGPANDLVTTDATGRYQFGDLPSGAYVISIRGVPSDAAFPSTSRTAAVPEGGVVTVDFQGSFIRTAAIVGTVRSGAQGLSGVNVRLDGTETATAQSDAAGEFRFSGLRAGFYTVQITSAPSSVTFTAPSTEVQLQTGQTHAVTFDGTPDLTASVVIQSIVRRTPSGGTEAVDPTEVRGRIEVNVAMDRGQDRPDSLLVLLGGEVVGKQLFQETVEAGAGAPLSSAQVLTFPVNTAAFDAQTGAVRFANGSRILTVRLATVEGGPSASTAAMPLVLGNRDTFVAHLEAEAGPVIGQDGHAWVGGDLEVDVVPVIYTPDRSVSTVSVEVRRLGGAQIARQSVAGVAPFRVLFSPDATGSNSLEGYRTPEGEVDQLRVIGAGYSEGGSVPGLPVVVFDSLRIDQLPPDPAPFQLPTQGAASACCSQNWVGEAFDFRTAVGTAEQEGVGGVLARVHAGAASASDTQLRGQDPVLSGAGLPESPGNAHYRAIAVLTNALGSQRTVPLEATTTNPLSNERGGVFGIDRTPPGISLEEGTSALPPRAINPPSGSSWVLGASDSKSGIGTTPFRTVVLRYVPGTAPTCVFPQAGECVPVPDGFMRELPAGGPGYYVLRTRALDRAGNRSPLLEAWVLRDTGAPSVDPLQFPSGLRGGSEITVTGLARDDVDLDLAWVGIRFGSPGGAGNLIPFQAAETVGEPFSGSLTTEGAFQVRFPFVEGLESVTTAAAPTGTVVPASRLVGVAVDAAGNRGSRSEVLSGSDGFQARSFRVAVRGQSGGVAVWTLGADHDRVCERDHEGVAHCTSGNVADGVTLEARASGAAGEFQNPFSAVHFIAVYPDDDIRYLGSSPLPELVADGTGSTGRVWGWSIPWVPDHRIPPGTIRLVAVGVDSDGAALRTREFTGVEVMAGS